MMLPFLAEGRACSSILSQLQIYPSSHGSAGRSVQSVEKAGGFGQEGNRVLALAVPARLLSDLHAASFLLFVGQACCGGAAVSTSQRPFRVLPSPGNGSAHVRSRAIVWVR